MRSQVFVPLLVLSIAGGTSAAAQTKPAAPATGSPAQAPKPATGSTAAGQPPAPAAPTTPPQAPPAAPAAPPQTPPAAPGAPAGTPLPPPSSESYTYQAEGRRDPFQNLITAPNETGRRTNARIGPAGMTVAEIQVRGVIQSSRGLLAMVLGSDNKTYIVHQGDPLLDGKIKQITPQGLIITQEVNDPLSLVKEREVRKLLRSLEDAK
jgi:Tfp pilus assembly protein PilP